MRAALRDPRAKIMPLRKFWSLLLLLLAPPLGGTTIGPALGTIGSPTSLAVREHQTWSSAVHDSELAGLLRAATQNTCEATEAPQALATPDPLLDGSYSQSKITVSFIIGTDGRVHGALILASAGPSEDRTVLEAVRSWRYRPARCNGVPTEAEAKVEFSSR